MSTALRHRHRPDLKHCKNCGWRIAWGRYCEDCVTMAGKTLLVVVIEEVVRWLIP